jgi:hypothetical protein
MLYGTGYYVTIYVLGEEKAGDKFTESHLLVRCIGKIHPAAGEFITFLHVKSQTLASGG